MRKIPDNISKIIIDTLPTDITEAIYIFVSYQTEVLSNPPMFIGSDDFSELVR